MKVVLISFQAAPSLLRPTPVFGPSSPPLPGIWKHSKLCVMAVGLGWGVGGRHRDCSFISIFQLLSGQTSATSNSFSRSLGSAAILRSDQVSAFQRHPLPGHSGVASSSPPLSPLTLPPPLGSPACHPVTISSSSFYALRRITNAAILPCKARSALLRGLGFAGKRMSRH